MFEGIIDAFHRELGTLEEKYASGKAPMTEQDLTYIDKMAHALKCMATYEAMESNRRPTRYIRDNYYR